jgi:phosphoglycolate phosphatase-like HAD superfamily hydrolase
MKSLILFDIDGTLVNLKKGVAAPIFFKAIKEVLGVEINPNIHIDFAGRTDYGILTYILKTHNFPGPIENELLEDIYNKIYEDFKNMLSVDSIRILEGVPILLELLSQNNELKLGLVTGNFKKNALLKLEMSGLDKYFSFGAFGDFLPNRLDLPKIALQNANSMNGNIFKNTNTLVIGDTHRDIQSAQHNKMKSLAVATGGSQYLELLKFNPDAIFESFDNPSNVYNTILSLFKKN